MRRGGIGALSVLGACWLAAGCAKPSSGGPLVLDPPTSTPIGAALPDYAVACGVALTKLKAADAKLQSVGLPAQPSLIWTEAGPPPRFSCPIVQGGTMGVMAFDLSCADPANPSCVTVAWANVGEDVAYRNPDVSNALIDGGVALAGIGQTPLPLP